MESKDFSELATEAKVRWSDAAKRVYEAASAELAAEMNERTRLGAQVAAARKALSLTQSELAELTGIPQPEISRIERGTGNPTAATLLRLADALGQRLTLVPA